MRAVILTILITFFIQADSTIELSLKNNYESALKEAKIDNKYLFIIVSKKNCGWCKKLKATTLKDSDIVENLDRDYVVVELDKNSNNFPSTMEVIGVPSIFIVDSKSGDIIKNIVGFRKNKNDYLKWFKYVKNL